ncbi:MAG: SDR family oxidoreductase [Cryobacterium sp.]|uniref:SDR family NAD(P)-dependent oxidoreductase n=1 Tax=unclassified Cryobacterium TaxID=2649013 RepID=UPI0018CAE264|nr:MULTISPECIES: SDR family oxidoreductase [unclassified Cryobacterium]MCY7404178.1 SDR family oxidoreductase [Cryobacterium sp.]MEC5153181.1 short-subunit dehydrogenase [Cryobacterium sp. CAN_C3]
MASALYNPIGTTALITGASSGLGVGYAHELAQRGADLVLVARRQARLEALAVDLAEKYGTVSTVIPLDLTSADAVTELVSDLRERMITIGTLVNNAGFATFGTVLDSDEAREREQIALNVHALTALTHAFLPELVETASLHPHTAALVNLASTAAFQPVPHMAVYGATKAYVLSYTEAVSYETRSSGLKVTAICPGPADTEFFEVAQTSGGKKGTQLTVEEVMRASFSALDRAVTPSVVLVGARNALLARVASILPRPAVLDMVGRMNTPRDAR